jgi:hypothetical protein
MRLRWTKWSNLLVKFLRHLVVPYLLLANIVPSLLLGKNPEFKELLRWGQPPAR